MKKTSFRKSSFIVGLGTLLLTVVWSLVLAPKILEMPDDFSFSADVVSIDNFYDEAREDYSGSIYSKTKYSYETVKSENDISTIKNIFEVRTPGDELIFSTERLYGIDQKTGKHIAGAGDRDREGYLFAPKHLKEGDSFTYWHVNYDGPAEMKFSGIENLYGLKTFRFESNYAGTRIDQTDSLTFLPNVGVTRGVELDPYLQLWVEPLTGNLIKYEDKTTAYFYDLETGERQNPWNQFSNKFRERSVEANVRATNLEKTKMQVVEIYLPIILIFLALIFLMKACNVLKKTLDYFTVPRLRKIVSTVMVLTGSLAILGWFLEIEMFIRVIPTANAMNPTTAMCFILLGLSLMFPRLFGGRFTVVLGFIVALISGIRLTETLGFEATTSIDLIFLSETIAASNFPARMAEYTALSFLFLSFVQLTSLNRRIKKLHVSEILTSSVFFFSLIAVIGYLFASLEVLTIPEFFFAAVHTALLFLISSAFMYFYHRKQDEYALNIRSWLSLNSVLLAAVLMTVVVASVLNILLTNEVRTKFQNEVDLAITSIEERVAIYINALEGARGLHSASDNVSREEWKSYVDALAIQENYPGIQGIGFSVFVKPEEKADHIAEVRAEGFPEYTIRPEGERDIYTSIVYLEPFDIRNRQAFGYDMFSNEVRRLAMELARDSGEAAISGRITLVQEIDEDVQPGFLIYVPYYKNGAPHETLEEKRENIVGYTYAPFRARNFVEGVIGENGIENISILIEDGTSGELDSVIYDDSPRNSTVSRFTESKTVYIAGRPWIITFSSSFDYGITTFALVVVPLTVLIGIIVSALISLIFYTLVSARQKAVSYADEVTKGLQEAKAKDEAMLASIGDAFVATDNQGKIVLVNHTFENLLKCSSSEVKGKKICDVIQVFDSQGQKLAAKDQPTMETLRKKKVITTTSIQYKRKNGNIFPVATTASPIIVNKSLTGAVEVFRDVTIEKEVDKAKTEFVSLASHQLRTPLTAINWYTEMLLSEKKLKVTKEQREYLDSIYFSNQRMVELVNALLDVSRLELGTFTIEPTKLDIAQLVRSVIKEQKSELDKKKLKLKTSFDKKVPTIIGDQKQLRMVFQNLISNAIKYTNKSGNISIELKKDKKDILFTIKDDGLGIPKDQQKKIFTKLFRADNVTVQDTDGTGLGLYIVKSIVENNGGEITFKSTENKGTTFFVKLPIKK